MKSRRINIRKFKARLAVVKPLEYPDDAELPAPPAYVPTPSEIREGCRAIQDGWSEHDEQNRRGLRGKPVPYEVPVVVDVVEDDCR